MNYFKRGDWLLRGPSSKCRYAPHWRLCRFLYDYPERDVRCQVEFWFLEYFKNGIAQYLSKERSVAFAAIRDWTNYGPEFERVEPIYLRSLDERPVNASHAR